jgi:hypothetical protein
MDLMPENKQHQSGASGGSDKPVSGILRPSGEEIAKYGGLSGSKPEGMKPGKESAAPTFDENFKKVLSGYSDEELNRMAEKGLEKMVKRVFEEALFGDALPRLKQELKEHRRSSLSPEVEDYFDDVKARVFLMNGGVRFQMMEDDRLGENMDIAMGLFKLEPKIIVPGKESKIDKLEHVLHEYPENVIEFLMRVPSEYLKLLIYYCKLEGFDDIKGIMDHKGNIDLERVRAPYGISRGYFEDPIELICSIGGGHLEFMIKQLNMTSMKEFDDFFFNTPELAIFMASSNAGLVNRIMEMEKVNSVAGFQKTFSDQELRDIVSRTDQDGNAWKNMDLMLSTFKINDLGSLKVFLNSDFPILQLSESIPNEFFSQYLIMSDANSPASFHAFLNEIGYHGRRALFAKNLSVVTESMGLRGYDQMMELLKLDAANKVLAVADPKNLKILLNISHFKNIGELHTALQNPKTATSLINAKFEELQALLDSTSNDEGKKGIYLYDLIGTMAPGDFESVGYLQYAMKSMVSIPRNMVDLIYQTLSKPGSMKQNTKAVCELMVKGMLRSSGDVDGVLELMRYSGGVLTTYLASEFLSTENRKSLLSEWTKVAAGFAEGRFDHDNELHRNLEYLRFHRMIGSEMLQRRMKNDSTYELYLRIFDRQKDSSAELSAKDKFEIKCVAYEAKFLRDFVTSEAAKVAKGVNRRLLIVPNLSYGYLPVSPIVDELSAAGVEFMIGAKVGSSQCHDNPDYIKGELFKERKAEIVNGQPVILVVDGTIHMVDLIEGQNSARYPDAYQGFLNQVIALNDSYGFVDVDYSRFGKTEDNMKSLRADPDFCAAVKAYSKARDDGTAPSKYEFGLWNSAGLKLVIRNLRNGLSESKSIDMPAINGPIMIFANVGMLHEQIPEGVRNEFEGLKHIPGYFDDSDRIIDIDFDFDNHGIKYLNRIEAEVKKEYRTYAGKQDVSNIETPEIIKSISKSIPPLRE